MNPWGQGMVSAPSRLLALQASPCQENDEASRYVLGCLTCSHPLRPHSTAESRDPSGPILPLSNNTSLLKNKACVCVYVQRRSRCVPANAAGQARCCSRERRRREKEEEEAGWQSSRSRAVSSPPPPRNASPKPLPVQRGSAPLATYRRAPLLRSRRARATVSQAPRSKCALRRAVPSGAEAEGQ